MTRILIRGGDIVTLDAKGTVLQSADLAVMGRSLVSVGVTPSGFEPEEIIDARGHIVMPGLYNAHMHSGTVFGRGLAGAATPDPWFDLRMTQDAQVHREITSAMTAEDAYWAALLAACEMIRGGVIGFRDQYFYMDRVAQAVVDSGLRAHLTWCTFGEEGGEIGGDLAAIAAFVETWQNAGEGRIRTSFGPHSPYLCSPQFLGRTAAVAARLGVGIHLRLAESQEQVDLSLLAYDLTPVQLLDQNGVLDLPVVAANVAYLTDFDLEILVARGVRVVACPKAQAAAGLAVTPIASLRDAGILVALGTDGAGLVGALDMFEVARHAQTHLRRDKNTFDAALGLATWGGAQVLGFVNGGRLIPDHSADLILIDRRRPHLWPVHDPAATALLGVCAGDVTDVMVAGRWLMRNHELATIDEERVLAEASRRAARLNVHQ